MRTPPAGSPARTQVPVPVLPPTRRSWDSRLLPQAKPPDRFGRAALRWHGRYCREVADVDLKEGQAVLAALSALPSKRRAAAARALAELLDRRGFERAGEVLIRWSNGHHTFGQ
jgi:hypothetical protein